MHNQRSNVEDDNPEISQNLFDNTYENLNSEAQSPFMAQE
jgi:hypothetical protein